MASHPQEFDPYHKWLGIPKGKRPPTYYELLGISLDEDDPEVIRGAAERRRHFVESRRGQGRDAAVSSLLYQLSEAEVTLLNSELRRDYDRRMDLFEKRRRKRRIDPNAPYSRIESRPGKTVGEGSGILGTFLGVMAVLLTGFGLMAWFSFHLPWSKVPDAGRQVAEAVPAKDPAKAPLPAAPAIDADDSTPVAMVPDGNLSKSNEAVAAFASAPSDGMDQVFQGHTDAITHLAVSPDGQYIGSASNDRTVRLWERETGREVWKTGGFNSNLFALSFSPEGNRLWVATRDTSKRLDTSSGENSKEMPFQMCNTSLIGGVTYGLGCARIAVSGKGWVRIYDNSRQKEMAVFNNTWAPCVALSQSGEEVFLGGSEEQGNVRLIKINGKKPVQSFAGLRDRTIALRVSPDGRYLAAASGPAQPKQKPSQNKVVVWEISSGRLIQEFSVPGGWQYGLAFSPDGRWLASGGGGTDEDWFGQHGSADKTVRLWEIRSGQQLQQFSGHTAAVRAVDFTPDGDRLITAGGDSMIRVWNTSPPPLSANDTAPSEPMRTNPNPATIEKASDGRVLQTKKGKMTGIDVNENTVSIDDHTFDLTRKTTITIHGKNATLSELKVGQIATILFNEKLDVVTQIDVGESNGDTPATDAMPSPALPDKDGFVSLFDGQTFNGWKLYSGGPIETGWAVVDGSLFLYGGRGGSIITEQEFSDFELEFEWKSQGNSGVMYRVRTGDAAPSDNSPEYQIYGEESGSLWKLVSVQQAVKPAFEFNQSRIMVRGRQIQHWLNGKKVVDIMIGSPAWNRAIAKSPMAKRKDFAKSIRGHICLQDNKGDIYFRNIRIRDLSK